MRLPAGQRFSEPSLTLQAAVNGLGVALARASLIDADLAAGRLVPLGLPVVPSAYRYYMLCLPKMDDDPRLARFREWLLAEMRTANAPLAGFAGPPPAARVRRPGAWTPYASVAQPDSHPEGSSRRGADRLA